MTPADGGMGRFEVVVADWQQHEQFESGLQWHVFGQLVAHIGGCNDACEMVGLCVLHTRRAAQRECFGEMFWR